MLLELVCFFINPWSKKLEKNIGKQPGKLLSGAVGIVLLSPDLRCVLLRADGGTPKCLKTLGGPIERAHYGGAHGQKRLMATAVEKVYERVGIRLDSTRLQPIYDGICTGRSNGATHHFFVYRQTIPEYALAIKSFPGGAEWIHLEEAVKDVPIAGHAHYVSRIFPEAVRRAATHHGATVH